MYRCQLCDNVSQPGQPLLRYVVQRDKMEKVYDPVTKQLENRIRKEIAREIPVCINCYHQILNGIMPITTFRKPTPLPVPKLKQVIPDNGISLIKKEQSNASVKGE
jgi:hypothetical protein